MVGQRVEKRWESEEARKEIYLKRALLSEGERA